MAMTFFEIDPVVIRVASDPQYFTYLTDAPRRPIVVEGDARLSFEDEPDARYDLVLMDAFSSDSVPIHLLTMEAIADEIRITKPDGLLVFHVSNRYYNLAPAIAAAVTDQGLTILEKWHAPGAHKEAGETPSHWLAASRDSCHARRADGGRLDARRARRPSVHRRLRRPTALPEPRRVGPAAGAQITWPAISGRRVASSQAVAYSPATTTSSQP